MATDSSDNLIDPQRWRDMDPQVRSRFHELGNHITRLEGIITGLTLRVPEKPATVPLLEQKVAQLDKDQTGLVTKVDALDDKLDAVKDELKDRINAVAVKVAGLTAVVVTVVDIATKHVG